MVVTGTIQLNETIRNKLEKIFYSPICLDLTSFESSHHQFRFTDIKMFECYCGNALCSGRAGPRISLKESGHHQDITQRKEKPDNCGQQFPERFIDCKQTLGYARTSTDCAEMFLKTRGLADCFLLGLVIVLVFLHIRLPSLPSQLLDTTILFVVHLRTSVLETDKMLQVDYIIPIDVDHSELAMLSQIKKYIERGLGLWRIPVISMFMEIKLSSFAKDSTPKGKNGRMFMNMNQAKKRHDKVSEKVVERHSLDKTDRHLENIIRLHQIPKRDEKFSDDTEDMAKVNEISNIGIYISRKADEEIRKPRVSQDSKNCVSVVDDHPRFSVTFDKNSIALERDPQDADIVHTEDLGTKQDQLRGVLQLSGIDLFRDTLRKFTTEHLWRSLTQRQPPFHPQRTQTTQPLVLAGATLRQRMTQLTYRIASMVHLRHFRHTAMSEAGLYLDEEGDVFRCFCCSLEVPRAEWPVEEDPRAVHLRMCPHCPHLNPEHHHT
ncbi:uncharacterized protein LOC143297769 [Babylonia areolata]|uniref:uncharacterized protein LOC143297769 n=1 Tax=Babylonia areolata TaxID=304850 RepID=UPI003FCF87A0